MRLVKGNHSDLFERTTLKDFLIWGGVGLNKSHNTWISLFQEDKSCSFLANPNTKS